MVHSAGLVNRITRPHGARIDVGDECKAKKKRRSQKSCGKRRSVSSAEIALDTEITWWGTSELVRGSE